MSELETEEREILEAFEAGELKRVPDADEQMAQHRLAAEVKVVKPLSDYRIYVEIEDGRQGVFDMKPYLDRGVFRELRDEHYFNQVGILFGAVTWPHEQDIAPETLIEEIVPVEARHDSGNDKSE
ncbi:DUF2442 domain-containing protein [Chlorobaculum thiosulfatiphilum]|nr:DUF2442 domain-containing protein [Chlorobaculum thiosulfatiphilum]